MLKMFFVNLLFLNVTHLPLHQLYITFQLQIKTYPSLTVTILQVVFNGF